MKANIISSNIVYEFSLFLVNLQEGNTNILHNDEVNIFIDSTSYNLKDFAFG